MQNKQLIKNAFNIINQVHELQSNIFHLSSWINETKSFIYVFLNWRLCKNLGAAKNKGM